MSYGIAKSVELVAVKVIWDDGSAWTTDVIEGLEWILMDHEARSSATGRMPKSVVNMSLAGPYHQGYEEVINALLDAGIIIVSAAGNYDNDACNYMPAMVSRVIAVAALDIYDVTASFTNYGYCVDISAPGVDIKSTSLNDSTAVLSGTSMSCPHGVGVVARYQSSLDYAPTPEQVSAINSHCLKSVNLP